MRESLAVGAVERLQVDFVIADACAHGYDGAQQFAMLAGIESRRRQLVPAFLIALMAYLPNKFIVSLWAEPRF